MIILISEISLYYIYRVVCASAGKTTIRKTVRPMRKKRCGKTREKTEVITCFMKYVYPTGLLNLGA